MSVMHHPRDETLLAHAAGEPDFARDLIVRAHLESCPACVRFVRKLEVLGGVMLAETDPVAMAGGSIERVMSRIDQGERLAATSISTTAQPSGMPRSLAGAEFGAWQWIAPGIRKQPIKLKNQGKSRLFLLKVGSRVQLPQHSHSASELTLVLSGSFSHQNGCFGPGDFDDADGAVDHTPFVDSNQECLCLVALEGQMKLRGVIGRVMQPFIRL